MQVDLVASQPHYREHLLPIWNALPAEVHGVDWGAGPAGPSDALLLVAGYADVERNFHRKMIYVEHGAGQTYKGLDAAVAPYYSGGPQHRGVIAYLCPNDEVAARWSGRYDRPTFVVGCPKLDPSHSGKRGEHEDRTVAITFHWDAVFTGVPETQSLFRYYAEDLRNTILSKWRREDWHIIGHNHPRNTALRDFWLSPDIRALGVEYVADDASVLDRASVLVADNTSLQAEFMSVQRPVVWVNHPVYRRDVEHGGRFWTWPERAGVQIDTPESLAQLDLSSVPASTFHPYAYADGHAAERGAAAILSLL